MGKLLKDIFDKSKDGSKADRRGFIRFAIVATAIFAVVLLVKKDSVLRWVQARSEISRQRRQIEWLQKGISEMDSQIERLSTNRDTLEAFARENYNFAEPGDEVFLLDESK